MRFRDRTDAGRRLADELARLPLHDPVVLALPRGGVPVAVEVARRLGAPLDVFVARKVGAPGREEFGIGAVAEGGTTVADLDSLAALGISRARFDDLAAAAREELARRVHRYRGDRPPAELAGRDVVLVDDGLATGVTAEVALRGLRACSPRSLVLAVPVCAPDTARRLGGLADHVVCVSSPADFRAVGLWYDDFAQTSDDEVLAALAAAERTIGIPLDDGTVVAADLTVPTGAAGLVVFAHGSGSGRRSSRNRAVAADLRARGLATLLVDVEADGADRVEAAVAWVRRQPSLAHLPVGCFGASTGAAAALVAAARRPDDVAAVVSRGGRPDLAAAQLGAVRAPTLLIVGGDDEVVLRLNAEAAGGLARAEHRLEVVPGASHLFEEPGALERVTELAGGWFAAHLRGGYGSRGGGTGLRRSSTPPSPSVRTS